MKRPTEKKSYEYSAYVEQHFGELCGARTYTQKKTNNKSNIGKNITFVVFANDKKIDTLTNTRNNCAASNVLE